MNPLSDACIDIESEQRSSLRPDKQLPITNCWCCRGEVGVAARGVNTVQRSILAEKKQLVARCLQARWEPRSQFDAPTVGRRLARRAQPRRLSCDCRHLHGGKNSCLARLADLPWHRRRNDGDVLVDDAAVNDLELAVLRLTEDAVSTTGGPEFRHAYVVRKRIEAFGVRGYTHGVLIEDPSACSGTVGGGKNSITVDVEKYLGRRRRRGSQYLGKAGHRCCYGHISQQVHMRFPRGSRACRDGTRRAGPAQQVPLRNRRRQPPRHCRPRSHLPIDQRIPSWSANALDVLVVLDSSESLSEYEQQLSRVSAGRRCQSTRRRTVSAVGTMPLGRQFVRPLLPPAVGGVAGTRRPIDAARQTLPTSSTA